MRFVGSCLSLLALGCGVKFDETSAITRERMEDQPLEEQSPTPTPTPTPSATPSATPSPTPSSTPAVMAIGTGGLRMFSFDGGQTWPQVQQVVNNGGDDDNGIRGVCYGAGMFVAVGGAGNTWLTYHSPNGTSIPALADPTGNWLGGCAYGNGIFVGAGGYGRKSSWSGNTSQHWTAAFDSHALRAIAFGGGAFVAVGDGGRRIRTTDGVNWTHDFRPGGNGLNYVAYGAGLFIATSASSSRTLYISSNHGVSWSTADLPAEVNGMGSTIWTGSEFVITVDTTAGWAYYTSPNGVNWTRRSLAPGAQQWIDIQAYVAGAYLGVRFNYNTNGSDLYRGTLNSSGQFTWTPVGPFVRNWIGRMVVAN